MTKIVVFGDSHTKFFGKEQTLSSLYHLGDFYENSICHIYDGATIKGFGKRKSTLNIREKILGEIMQNDIVVLCFGQVDIELGIYFKKFVKCEDESLDDFLTVLIQSYQLLIDMVKPQAKEVIIKGVNLPVLIEHKKAVRYTHRIISENLSDKEEIQKTRQKLAKGFPGIHQRISFSKLLNEKLQHLARANGVGYFDINAKISYSNGLVKEEFIPAFFDHHLADTLQVRLIHWECLKNAVSSI
ncbi:MAG: hypothetical protein A2511_17485 [Deltaproteobacteria bacterium RIFOXYD12_FULL_50_9]|nr:MAG: hypothetical protein A2511_17485 [Deltaproteobacteria bacterium RIFOXYD12_FULL_50_9]